MQTVYAISRIGIVYYYKLNTQKIIYIIPIHNYNTYIDNVNTYTMIIL